MRELTEKHTSENIKKVILEIFKTHNIDINNIYSITTDNASNMVKLIKLLMEHEDIDDKDMMLSHENNLSNISNIDDVDETDNIIFSMTGALLVGFRCASHTFHLAINDCIKSSLNELLTKPDHCAKKFAHILH
ncbi:unnamed protein product [Gordionus sp. m RMFG-2023]